MNTTATDIFRHDNRAAEAALTCHGTAAPACHGTAAPACHGTAESACRGTAESACRGTAESACRGTAESACRGTAAVGNAVRGRLNAAVLRMSNAYGHLLLGRRKRRLLASLPPTVVEIGPGTGANLRYYRPGTRLIAIEPNRHMHSPLRKAAQRYGIEVELREEGADAIGLPDASVDAVVSTLVLCTVPDPAATLREVRRILRPGGRFLFLEHVRAGQSHPVLRVVQRSLARPWRWFFEGCDVLRDTEATLARTGWAHLEVQRYHVPTLFLPINTQIAGTAFPTNPGGAQMTGPSPV